MYVVFAVVCVEQLCSCDQETCHIADTCCEDIRDTSLIPRQRQTCVRDPSGSSSFYAVKTCSDEYRVAELEEKCLTPLHTITDYPSKSDMLTYQRDAKFASCDIVIAFVDMTEWIVSSWRTNVTYRNVYCAMCNGENMEDVVFWELSIECEKYDNQWEQYDYNYVQLQDGPQTAGTTTETTTETATDPSDTDLIPDEK